jgi:hypothetical protein
MAINFSPSYYDYVGKFVVAQFHLASGVFCFSPPPATFWQFRWNDLDRRAA